MPDTKVRGAGLLANSVSIRSTRKRLLGATLLSACFLAMTLLFLDRFLDIRLSFSDRISRPPQHPVVRLLQGVSNDDPETVERDHVAELQVAKELTGEGPETRRTKSSLETVKSEAGKSLPNDWRSTFQNEIESSIDNLAHRATAQEALWRKTGSVMYKATDELNLREEAPLLANFRFKPEVHVFGLGVTIGSCFVGIPIAGVPVEERTVAIRLFVCASESG